MCGVVMLTSRKASTAYFLKEIKNHVPWCIIGKFTRFFVRAVPFYFFFKDIPLRFCGRCVLPFFPVWARAKAVNNAAGLLIVCTLYLFCVRVLTLTSMAVFGNHLLKTILCCCTVL